MKRTALIPLLLSTFLLVGCETETDLNRCIEANTADGFDQAQYRKKMDAIRIKRDSASELPINELLKEMKETEKNLISSLTAVEIKVYKCGQEKFSDRLTELTDIGFSPSEATEKIIQEEGEILTACLPRNQAERICNSQGIY